MKFDGYVLTRPKESKVEYYPSLLLATLWYLVFWTKIYLKPHPFRDHPFKTSACLRGEGCPHVPMVKRSQYIRIKKPLHKHFAGMPKPKDYAT